MKAPETPQSLTALDRELERQGVACELCTAGGALFSLVFDADPPSRNVKALFRPARILRNAASTVQRDLELPEFWLSDAVRLCLGPQGVPGWIELPHLRVFEALPEYVLAMKCAALEASEEPDDRDDIRYLLRLLHLSGSGPALTTVHRYFTERQLPADLETFLDGLSSA